MSVPGRKGVRTIGSVVAVLVVSAALGGCGRGGALEPAPDPSVPPPRAADANNPAAGLRRPKNPPIKPPHDSFILDPLL